MYVVDWNEEKTTVVILCCCSVWFLTFRSAQTSSFVFVCCCLFGCLRLWSRRVRPSCCLQCLCFLHILLCFSTPKFMFVHKPNTARYCCFWHLHWDEHPVLNGLNIWQYPALSLLRLSCHCVLFKVCSSVLWCASRFDPGSSYIPDNIQSHLVEASKCP